jgi:hypothetical protein
LLGGEGTFLSTTNNRADKRKKKKVFVKIKDMG